MSRTEPPRLAVLGAGPVGLECALYAAALKYPVRVYERGQVGANLRRWGHVKLFTPFGMNSTPLGRATLTAEDPRRALPADGDLLTGREHVAAYLEPLAASPSLAACIEAGCAVLSIGRKGQLKEEMVGDPRRATSPFRLLLRAADGKERVEEADVVLDCTGTYGHARHLGDGGIAAIGELGVRDKITWGLDDILGERRKHYADRNVLVVGAGHTAASSVALLAKLAQQTPSTWIVWLARRAGSQPIRRIVNDPLKERDHLAARANMLATRGEGHVEFHAQSQVVALEPTNDGFTVRALVAGEERSWPVERIVANVGYEPDNALYRELQVHECYASLGPMKLAAALSGHANSDCLAVPAQGAATLRNPEPNFYILGSKSYGRHSNFLLRTGLEQVRAAFTLITEKPDLDLNRKGARMSVPLPVVDRAAPEVRLAHLDQLWFQVTGTLCNLTCHHCFISCSPHNRTFGFLPLDEVKRRLDESKMHGVKEYYFTGGEPFLHPAMAAILELTLGYGPASVLTNGTVLKPEWLTRLRRAEEASPYCLEFRVSIDGCTAEANDPVRGEGTFARAMRGVELLLAHDFLPIVTVARTDDDQDDAELFAGFVDALKARGYHRPRVKILPTLRLGAEADRRRGYGDEFVTPEMMDGFDPGLLLCSSARLVSDHGVHVCPILLEAPDGILGQTLAEATRPFALRHRACHTCWQHGSICSNPSATARPA